MKTRTLLVTVVIITCALGSILYVGSTFLRVSAPETAGSTHVVEYGVQFFPYLIDSMDNQLVSDLRPRWFRIYAPSWAPPYPDHEKLMMAFPNVNILMTIETGTMGAWDEGCTFRQLHTFRKAWLNAKISSCDWSLEDWDANVTRLVKAFPNVHAWEIWSQPDLMQGGYLCCDDNVALLAHHYFDMLKDAYQIIKAHDPNDIVIAFSVNLFTEGMKDDWIKQFVGETMKLGGSDYFDAVSFQAYPISYPSYMVDRPGSAWTQLPTLQALTGKPVWITSTNIPSNDENLGGSTPETQATFLTQAFTFLSHYSYVKVIIWNCLTNPSDIHDTGLVTIAAAGQVTPKPAYYAFQNFTKNQTITTSTSAST